MKIKPALLIATLPCLITGYFSFFGWRDEFLLSQLGQRGQEVQAVVTESNPAERGGRVSIPAQLVYQFSFAGRSYTSDAFVSDAMQRRTGVGDDITVRFLPNAPDVSKPVGLSRIFFEVGGRIGLIAATAYTIFGVCFFCFAHWKLRQMETKRAKK